MLLNKMLCHLVTLLLTETRGVGIYKSLGDGHSGGDHAWPDLGGSLSSYKGRYIGKEDRRIRINQS